MVNPMISQMFLPIGFVLKALADYVGIVVGLFWDRFRIVLVSASKRAGVVLESFTPNSFHS